MPPETSKSEDYYNATIAKITPIADGLSIFHLKPDEPIGGQLPGHYVSIGLFDKSRNKLVRRPYSLSQSLTSDPDSDLLELLVIRVPEGDLTPALFERVTGDRLFIRPKMLGTYLLPELDDDMTIIFASTGTGVSPHMTMLKACVDKCRQVVMMECVRYSAELAYASQIQAYAAERSNLLYLPLVTREGGAKRYIQEFFSEGILEQEHDIKIDAAHTHVFACGNPAMIGIPREDRKTGALSFNVKNGLVETLIQKYDLSIHKPRRPGEIHFEKYW